VRIVDVNVLLYAVNASSAHHRRARGWLDDALAGPEPVGFTWPVLLAFLRLATHRAIFERPLTVTEAAAVVRDWLGRPGALVVEPSARHLDLLAGLLEPIGTAGNLVADAHLAAIAVEHGAAMVSFDTDFQRFTGLRLELPTAAS
jgi:toxin-antitoxin system PIN domain toxin